jgi:hypothetical protein
MTVRIAPLEQMKIQRCANCATSGKSDESIEHKSVTKEIPLSDHKNLDSVDKNLQRFHLKDIPI